MLNHKQKERREYQRAEAAFETTYMPDPGDIPTYTCTLRDVGTEGIGVVTMHEMELGSTALVSFNLPNYPKIVISPARVIWSRRRYSRCLSGLKLIQLHDHDKDALDTYISKHQTAAA